MRVLFEFWAWKAGLKDPLSKMLRDGWNAAEILTRLTFAYQEYKGEMRSYRKFQREQKKQEKS